MSNQVIGIFDSGVGGLTVLHECVKLLPRASYLYLGDNSRAPYGSRPKEEIEEFTREALEKFRARGVCAAVLACNTATAVCLGKMRRCFSFPIIGTEPAVLPAAKAAKDVLVLCTPRTAESKRLSSLLARCPETRFTVCGAPRLASAVEDLMLRNVPLDLRSHLPEGEYGAVALGCTHYGFLKNRISEFCHAPVFDSAEGVARQVFRLLKGKFQYIEEESAHNCKVLNTNKSLQEMTQTDIEFLGNMGYFNEMVYKQTFTFNKLE